MLTQTRQDKVNDGLLASFLVKLHFLAWNRLPRPSLRSVLAMIMIFFLILSLITLPFALFTSPVLAYTTNMSASVVVGQADFTSATYPAPTANTFYNLTQVKTDGTHLFVSDFNNSRVLIYNHIPTTNNASADVVVGQPSLTSPDPNGNQGGSNPSANTLFGGGDDIGIAPTNDKLIVAEQITIDSLSITT